MFASAKFLPENNLQQLFQNQWVWVKARLVKYGDLKPCDRQGLRFLKIFSGIHLQIKPTRYQ